MNAAVVEVSAASVIEADYTWQYTDRWINFPWSVLPVITPESVAPGPMSPR